MELTFVTSNRIKLAHARHLCEKMNVNVDIIHYKKKFYGVGYVEPQIFDRERLLQDSFEDAIQRWEKNVSPKGNHFFFIEDTSVKIEGLSDSENEVPGVDVKYWMRSMTFEKLDRQLKENGNNRNVRVMSHVILYLTEDLRKKLNCQEKYKVFYSYYDGTIVEREFEIQTNILYPWLDSKSFNKWFVPQGHDVPISMLPIADADNCDFRKKAFEEMILFLQENGAIESNSNIPAASQMSLFSHSFIFCGPTCSGKTTAGRFFLEKYGLYHIEASDFMAMRYRETCGLSCDVDKHEFAKQLLRESPIAVVEMIVAYMRGNNISDDFVVTGFRNIEEVNAFTSYYHIPENGFFYLLADADLRFERWKSRHRDNIEYSKDAFERVDTMQDEMGLSDIRKDARFSIIKNNTKHKDSYYKRLEQLIENRESQNSIKDLKDVKDLSLEQAILIVLYNEYVKDDAASFTTTEISHMIERYFNNVRKNKNNISRYFNQSFYPYYEINQIGGKNKIKLSPIGYSKTFRLIRDMTFDF